MTSPPSASASRPISEEEKRAELEAVLSSPLLSRAPSLRSFLEYICNESFAGRADELKEYSIAIEALGRGHDFDHTKDSIVRVEAHKLRKRLASFYETEGARHALVIEIPPGSYAPAFVARSVLSGAASHATRSSSASSAVESTST